MRRGLTIACATLVLVPVGTRVGAEHIPPLTRYPALYLTAPDTDATPAWGRNGLVTVDPEDPRATAATLHHSTVGDTLGGRTFVFRQADRLFDALPGGTFQVGVEVDEGQSQANGVTFWVMSGASLHGPYPATRASRSIWRGEVDAETIGDGEDELAFAVQVFAPQSGRTTILTDGTSWYRPHGGIRARSLAEVQSLSPPASAPGTLETRWRSFTFNDGEYTFASYEGVLSETPQRHSFELSRPATILYAWVELESGQLVPDLLEGRVRTGDMTDMPLVSIEQDGGVIASGSNNPHAGNKGQPVDTAAVDRLPPGPLAVRVEAKPGSDAVPYRAYVLAIHGERTIASMRASFLPRATGEDFSLYGTFGLSSVSREPLLFLEPAAVAHVRFSHDGPLADHQEFDLEVTTPYGSKRVADDDLWISRPATPGVWTVGQAPTNDAISASAYDVVFTMSVEYWYDPVPHPAEETA